MRAGQLDLTGSMLEKFRLEGIAEGEVKHGITAVLLVLMARGLDVPQAVEQRIRDCQDVDQLNRWLTRAVVIASIDELFDEDPPHLSA